MCGICGISALRDGFAVDEELVTRCARRIVHRGPDDGGSWQLARAAASRSATAGSRSSTSRRPATSRWRNEDGTVWITFNGEIYNHADLRAELEAQGPRLPLAHRHRDDHPPVRGGGPALRRAPARDVRASRSGTRAAASCSWPATASAKKPLYYAQPPGGFVFASEIKALLEHPAISPDLDEEAFFHYLTFVCTPAPLTMFEGIRKLGAGRADDRARPTARIESETYWSPMSRTRRGRGRARCREAEMRGAAARAAARVDRASG